MDKNEIAYELTAILVEKTRYAFVLKSGESNEDANTRLGKEIANLYNSIYSNISFED